MSFSSMLDLIFMQKTLDMMDLDFGIHFVNY